MGELKGPGNVGSRKDFSTAPYKVSIIIDCTLYEKYKHILRRLFPAESIGEINNQLFTEAVRNFVKKNEKRVK